MVITGVWFPEAAIAAAGRSCRAGAAAGGEAWLGAANTFIPYRTGALMQSGRLESDGEDAFVSYDEPYARPLWAHPEWDYNGRSGHWLIAAQDAAGEEIARAMEEAARGAWPGG